MIAPVLSIRMLVARRVSSAPCTLPGHAHFDGLLTTCYVASLERLDGFAVERMQRQCQGCHESGTSHETPHVPASARVVPGLHHLEAVVKSCLFTRLRELPLPLSSAPVFGRQLGMRAPTDVCGLGASRMSQPV